MGDAVTTVPPVASVAMDVCATVIATVVASAISAIVAWLVGRHTVNAQMRQSLRNHVDRIVDLGIAYPRLENDAFCQRWNPKSQDEESMRYDNYCCHVFNLLERVWQFTRGDTTMMREFVYFEELIVRHKTWWCSQRENKVGYELGFRQFVDGIIVGGRRT